jgi:glyoxylase-like metal-dependent hydrolase (beta-lactamase superfamily II)
MNHVAVHALFDKATFTLTYVVWDQLTRDAVVIDPVLDYDPASKMISKSNLKRVVDFVRNEELRVHWILDTHAHADHLSSGRELKSALGHASFGLSARMVQVLETFKKAFHWPADLTIKGTCADRLFQDGEEFTAGSLRLQAIATPGHTAACTTYRIGNKLFTGDAIFMPDSGVGRCDFPGGSAKELYKTVTEKIFTFPEEFEIFVGHDYQPGGRPLRYRSTVGKQRQSNIHLRTGVSESEFVKFREGRDKTLNAPRLLEPSLDWNLGAHQSVPK